MNRREFIAITTAALALPGAGRGAEAQPVFEQRGYYILQNRAPTMGGWMRRNAPFSGTN